MSRYRYLRFEFILLILASASKARHRLLEQVGINHEVMVSDVDEELFFKNDIHHLVVTLAQAKARNVACKISRKYSENDCLFKRNVILGCDSIFEFEGNAFGKPRDDKEAISRLRAISSKTGFLHTGHCLLRPDFLKSSNQSEFYRNIQIEVITTKIQFSQISNDEIFEYVSSGEPLECAGGFSIDGKGSLFVKSIEGCFSNVIGLSLPWIKEALMKV